MRECWINVYVLGSGVHALGWTCRSIDEAKRAEQATRSVGVSGPAYRLHVRLKPEMQILTTKAEFAERIARGDYGRILDPAPGPGALVIEPSAKPAGQGGQWHADRLAALMGRR